MKDALEVPIVGVVSDGQLSIRKAVEKALPEAAHGLCHFHASQGSRETDLALLTVMPKRNSKSVYEACEL